MLFVIDEGLFGILSSIHAVVMTGSGIPTYVGHASGITREEIIVVCRRGEGGGSCY